MNIFGIRGREEPLIETILPGVSENVSGFVNDVGGAAFDGLDAAAGNTISDPNAKTISEGIRDFAIEAVPGNQRTNLDVDFGEGNIKTVGYLQNEGIGKTAIKNRVQQRVGNLRETAAEKTLNAGVRKAGQALLPAIGKTAAKNLGRVGAGLAGGPAVAGPLAVWGIVDTVDTGLQVATGKGLMDYQSEGKFGDSGYYRGSVNDQKIIDERNRRESQDATRPFGTEAVLGGKPVMWGGDDYGWQSPESFKNIKRY